MIFIRVGTIKVRGETSTITRVIFMIFIKVGPIKVCSETSTRTCSLIFLLDFYKGGPHKGV